MASSLRKGCAILAAAFLLLRMEEGRAADFAPFYRDALTNKLDEGWSWIRENKAGWKTSPDGLKIRVEPGNMWGPPNDARNVLVRAVPDPGSGAVAVEVTVENRPTEQYEQMDLVWYYDDSHMVKMGYELVDGKRCVVMGREEKDKTRTIAILGHPYDSVRLRLIATSASIRGEYLFPGSSQWLIAGVCSLPAKGASRVSIQCYQGPGHIDHWGLLKDFVIYTLPDVDALGTDVRPTR